MGRNKKQTISVLIGLQHGDEGKGKISKWLSDIEKYDCFVRFNGGPNAGHTIYIDGKKLVLHQIPCGIVNNKVCLISSNCVIDMDKLLEETKLLLSYGINVYELLHIAYNAHIITNVSIDEDKKTDKIGTTGSGIGPTYSRKALRVGTRYSDLDVKPFNEVNPYLFLENYKNIFMEGAQGFELDIDYGDYPYVTSSSCLAGSVYINGVKPGSNVNVIGVCKLYDTYVGSKLFQPDDEVFKKLQILGNEIGATTGRSRQCNWLNLSSLVNSIIINNINDVYINKCDIIEKLGVFKLIEEKKEKEFNSLFEMKEYIYTVLTKKGINNVIFSSYPDKI